jgi:hypothetical protein
MPKFVEFSRREARAASEDPMFTLQVRGLISFNHAAYIVLDEPTAVALLYDARERIVALRKVPKNHENAYLVRHQQNAQSYTVGAEAFTRFHGLTVPVALRFPGNHYGDDIWGFDLSQGTPAASRGRGRRPADSTPGGKPTAR